MDVLKTAAREGPIQWLDDETVDDASTRLSKETPAVRGPHWFDAVCSRGAISIRLRESTVFEGALGVPDSVHRANGGVGLLNAIWAPWRAKREAMGHDFPEESDEGERANLLEVAVDPSVQLHVETEAREGPPSVWHGPDAVPDDVDDAVLPPWVWDVVSSRLDAKDRRRAIRLRERARIRG
jgi:hypothetical protein